MKRLIVACSLFVGLIGAAALAGKTQVAQGTWRMLTNGAFAGRSDGVAQEVTSKGIYAIENGTSAGPIGVGLRETFAHGDDDGIACLDLDGVGTCAGNTTLAPCLCSVGGGFKFLWIPLVTADLPPDMDASSLDIGSDQTNNDGAEMLTGLGGASGRPFVIGEDPAFYACATIGLTDVSGSDDLHFGFREAEAATATFDNYTDLATIGSISGDIYIETIIGNAATVSTDTTDNWADAATKKLCVFVSNAGVVTYTIDGSAPTATAAYTFTDGLSVVPFLHYLHDSDLVDEIDLTLWEVGYQN